MNQILQFLLVYTHMASCIVMGYVAFNILVRSERPETWLGWVYRVTLASVAAAGVVSAVFPPRIDALPLLLSTWLRFSVGLAAFLFFAKEYGWRNHFKQQWDAFVDWLHLLVLEVSHYRVCGPALLRNYTLNAKICWNERVDNMRGRK